jgi:hypothetical protein
MIPGEGRLFSTKLGYMGQGTITSTFNAITSMRQTCIFLAIRLHQLHCAGKSQAKRGDDVRVYLRRYTPDPKLWFN